MARNAVQKRRTPSGMQIVSCRKYGPYPAGNHRHKGIRNEVSNFTSLNCIPLTVWIQVNVEVTTQADMVAEHVPQKVGKCVSDQHVIAADYV